MRLANHVPAFDRRAFTRFALEMCVWAVARICGRWPKECPDHPTTIFVLRNNDIGDLLVSTPLFEALRRRFPAARIVVGVTDWNVEVLEGNPHVSEVMRVNAPWFNRGRPSHGIGKALRYILFSPEARAVARLKPDIGIDVVGSQMGALFLLRAGVPFRLGSKGYAGGHTAAQRCVVSGEERHVGESVLEFARLLGAERLPGTRPQIYLTAHELQAGNEHWNWAQGRPRIVVAPGSSTPEKSWPIDRFDELCCSLGIQGHAVAVIGSKEEIPLGERLAETSRTARHFCGELTLRETFAVIATADVVISNSSMAMHAAAAFSKPTVIVLGKIFRDAAAHQQCWGHKNQVALGGHEGSMAAPQEVASAITAALRSKDTVDTALA